MKTCLYLTSPMVPLPLLPEARSSLRDNLSEKALPSLACESFCDHSIPASIPMLRVFSFPRLRSLLPPAHAARHSALSALKHSAPMAAADAFPPLAIRAGHSSHRHMPPALLSTSVNDRAS